MFLRGEEDTGVSLHTKKYICYGFFSKETKIRDHQLGGLTRESPFVFWDSDIALNIFHQILFRAFGNF